MSGVPDNIAFAVRTAALRYNPTIPCLGPQLVLPRSVSQRT